MDIGILNNCTPQEEIDFSLREIDSFRAFFAPAAPALTLREYRVTEGELPRRPEECSAYLLTGSPKGVYDDDPWIEALAGFVRQSYASGRKLVGICFGHQLLSHALGGRAERSARGWGMGRRAAEIVRWKPWMRPPLAVSHLYYCHQDQVVALPPGAELLARNEFCPYLMFTLNDQVLATQAHPEFTAETMRHAVTYFHRRLPADFMAEVAATLRPAPTDGQLLAQWIVNFMMEAEERLEAGVLQPDRGLSNPPV